ncbi:UNVERIFIED_CONTAM: hypothetical protein GTU68_044246 [Idotea baltica]|nr:hypothetical protein [Idotea baltica]
MGILNLTPDSFSDGGAYDSFEAALNRVGEMLEEGADIIDIGGYSSRPYADPVSAEEELERIHEITSRIIKEYPEALISIDTFRASVASSMLDLGVHIINDISAGEIDPELMSVVAKQGSVPYIMMHMKGTPQTMQDQPQYDNITEEVWAFFVGKINEARKIGIKDIVLDPGFGFGKTISHNYELLYRLNRFSLLDLPILVGISRKSMMYKFFDTVPTDVLPIATALHLKAIESGAHLIRTHDVKEVVRVIELTTYLQEHGII